MASNEMQKSSSDKEPKTLPPPPPSSQAYSSMPPHGFVASSPQPHPYMWGVQHMMPPYGTPTHSGLINIAPMLCLLKMEWPKLLGDSASDGSNEGSDANSQNDSGSEHDGKDDTSENGTSANGLRDGSVATPLQPVSQTVPVTDAGVPGPPTNLNIGTDYWGAPASASTLVPGVLAPVSRDGGHSQPWLQDDREVRRKQSNRESARRSRLRKQAECDELAQRADVLNGENASLREEINKLRSQTNFYHSLHLKALTWTRTSKNHQTSLKNTSQRQKRRKQSNRESARRSRLRKQAECDELAQRADVLNGENASLREEINKLRSQTNFYHSLHLKALTWTRTSKNHQTSLKNTSQRQKMVVGDEWVGNIVSLALLED
ncbi:hypothetical protein F2Q68_00027981, partial [Brassica cretica]